MTGLVNATFQLNLGQKTDDDVWLAWFWKLSNKTLKQMMLMMRGWRGLWKLCGTTLWQMMLMMRGCPGQ